MSGYPGNYGQGGYPQQGGYGGGYGGPPPPPPPPGQGWGGYGPPGGGGPPGGYGGFPPPGPPPGQGYGYQAPGYGGYGGGGGGGGGGFPTGQQYGNQYQVGSAGAQPQGRSNYGAPSPSAIPTGVQNYGPHFQKNDGSDTQPYFQYSNCTGKKKALMIGINYYGQKNELAGCIADAENVQKFLVEMYHYKPEDMVVLRDDSSDPRTLPTRANIIRAIGWLVAGAQPNDSLFFHYSGHGGLVPDQDGDEEDGYDECIYPMDFQSAGEIIDDELHDRLVKPLPPGCKMSCLFDCCHSGSGLDLPYQYSTQGVIKEPNLAKEAGQGLLSAGLSYARGDLGGAVQGLFGLGKKLMKSNGSASKKVKETKTSPADVISWSGCKDDQTSADASVGGEATGAMSFAFIQALRQNPQQSYVQLLNSVREILRNKYSQKPQLSASHPMDMNILVLF